MARPRKGQAVQDKIDKYLEEYELDDLNQANDMAALQQMCQIEVTMEKIYAGLDKLDAVEDTKKIKELNAALRDANQNWTTLQTQLGIDRKKRQSDSDETPLQYVERIQELSRKFMESRLVKLTCPKCGQALGKYLFYVTEKGEHGSIESETKEIESYRYTVRCECWKCSQVAEISNEDIAVVAK